MKKKYKKPELRNLGCINQGFSGTKDYAKPTGSIEVNYASIFEPEIKYDPSKLPESVSFEGPKCPKCGTRAEEMVMYKVMNGGSLSKNHCRKCGHVWGPGE